MAKAEITEPVEFSAVLYLTGAEARWLKAVCASVDGDGSVNRLDVDIWNALDNGGLKAVDTEEELMNYSVMVSNFGCGPTY